MRKVIEYYTEYDEDSRLERHRTEFVVTTHILDQYIKPEYSILDVAAGTGAYAFYLAERGCRVHAEDITPANIDKLQSKTSKRPDLMIRSQIGDARDLGHLESNRFDAVLCMGPVYHIDLQGTKKCIEECTRVLKEKGILVVAYLNKRKDYKTDKYADIMVFHHPSEIEAIVGNSEISRILNCPVDGDAFSELAPILQSSDYLNTAHRWLDSRSDLCRDTNWEQSAIHALYVGRKTR